MITFFTENFIGKLDKNDILVIANSKDDGFISIFYLNKKEIKKDIEIAFDGITTAEICNFSHDNLNEAIQDLKKVLPTTVKII